MEEVPLRRELPDWVSRVVDPELTDEQVANNIYGTPFPEFIEWQLKEPVSGISGQQLEDVATLLAGAVSLKEGIPMVADWAGVSRRDFLMNQLHP